MENICILSDRNLDTVDSNISFNNSLFPNYRRSAVSVEKRVPFRPTAKTEKPKKMAPSGDLIWTLVRNNSCFIKKQKNVPVFTSEAGNLSGLNSYKYLSCSLKQVFGPPEDMNGIINK